MVAAADGLPLPALTTPAIDQDAFLFICTLISWGLRLAQRAMRNPSIAGMQFFAGPPLPAFW